MNDWTGLRASVAALLLAGAGSLSLAQEESTPPPSAPPPSTSDFAKGVTFSSGDNSLSLGFGLQLRYTADDREAFDADLDGASGDGQEDGLTHSFDIPRMRLYVRGGFWKPWLKYQLQYELSRTSGESSSKIKDAALDFVFRPAATLRVGQFKTPFSLQELTSSGRQQFVDRAITNGKFAAGRDVGVMITGVAAEKRFGYSAGVFNGGGESRQQDDTGLLYVGRVWCDPLGEYKLLESANEAEEEGVFHVGLGLHAGEAIRGTESIGVVEDVNDQTAWSLELAGRWKRLSATGEYFSMTDDVDNVSTVGTPIEVDSDGWHAQIGFMVTPTAFELAVRHAFVDPDVDTDNDEVTETRLAASYYWKGHSLKVQGDVGQLSFDSGFRAYSPSAVLTTVQGRGLPNVAAATTTTAGRISPLTEDLKDLQVRVQVQLVF
jgi:hypothetical protein